jgi:hypothetical protein
VNVRRTFLVTTLVLFTTACGGGDDTVAGATGNVAVDDTASGDAGDGAGDAGGTGAEGQTTGVALPDGWPQDFPVPDDAVAVAALGGGGGGSVWYSSSLGYDELRGFFDTALPLEGYTIDSFTENADPSAPSITYNISGNGWSGGVSIGSSVNTPPGFGGEPPAIFVNLAAA